tara:strand:- start:24355 stop:24984 length:630 start_codon:yes stop_codon:yes gene_type:complete
MALIQNDTSRTYLSVHNGQFARYHKDANGNHAHDYYKKVTGRLTDISYFTRPQTEKQQYENPREIQLHIQDGDESYVLCVPSTYRYGESLQKVLPNIDPKKEVEFSIMTKDKETTIFVNQMNEETGRMSALKWFWTKENPRDIPQPEKFMNPKTKKEEWIWDAVHQYLEEYILANVKPTLLPPEPVNQTSVPDFGSEIPDFDDNDDPPF